MSASTTVESIRAARTTKRRAPAPGLVASAAKPEQIASITSAPRRRTSLRIVDSSGTRSHSPKRQNRRECSESETSRTAVAYPQPDRALTTISRTKRSIGTVGRPKETASAVHDALIGANTPDSDNNTSMAARSAGNSATQAGSPRSNNDSTCPPDKRSTTDLHNRPICRTIMSAWSDGTATQHGLFPGEVARSEAHLRVDPVTLSQGADLMGQLSGRAHVQHPLIARLAPPFGDQ